MKMSMSTGNGQSPEDLHATNEAAPGAAYNSGGSGHADEASIPVSEERDTRLERWESWADIPLSIAALIFLICYAIPILDPDIPAPWPRVLSVTNAIIWIFFGVDYVLRVIIAHHHWHYIRTHILDLLIVVLPFFQPLRLLRLVVLLRVLNRRAGVSLRGRIGMYLASASAVVVVVAALAVLDSERGVPGSQLDNFADALWWAVVSVTTVGYGDIAPVTASGRIIAAGLMICGIGLLGTITGMLASWMVEKISDDSPENQAATRADVEHSEIREHTDAVALEHELVELKDRLAHIEEQLESLVSQDRFDAK